MLWHRTTSHATFSGHGVTTCTRAYAVDAGQSGRADGANGARSASIKAFRSPAAHHRHRRSRSLGDPHTQPALVAPQPNPMPKPAGHSQLAEPSKQRPNLVTFLDRPPSSASQSEHIQQPAQVEPGANIETHFPRRAAAGPTPPWTDGPAAPRTSAPRGAPRARGSA